MVNALTVRIALSVLLFVLLLVAWWSGLIEPHGARPVGHGRLKRPATGGGRPARRPDLCPLPLSLRLPAYSQ